MRTTACVFLSLGALFQFSATGAAQTNLIANGGFETPIVSGYATFSAPGGFAGWTIGSGAVDVVANTFFAPAAGSQSLDLNSVLAGSVRQNIATTATQAYVVRFAFSANPLPDDPQFPSPAVKQMQVTWNGVVRGTYSRNSTGFNGANVGWQEYEFQVVGTGADTIAFASLTAGSAGPTIDNVRLFAVPEPSTVVLAAMTFLGWGRRRSKPWGVGCR